jgi:hypothetical protein
MAAERWTIDVREPRVAHVRCTQSPYDLMWTESEGAPACDERSTRASARADDNSNYAIALSPNFAQDVLAWSYGQAHR